jgi:hypothetical protein
MGEDLEEEFSCVVAEEEDFEYDLDLLLRRYNVNQFIGLYSLDGNQIDSMMTCSKATAKIMLSMGLNHLGKGD